MNPSKVEDDPDPFFLHHHFHHSSFNHHPSFNHNHFITTSSITNHNTNTNNNNHSSFSLFNHTSPCSSPSSSDSPPPSTSISKPQFETLVIPTSNDIVSPSSSSSSSIPKFINPEPHISSQFYTFNCESHGLMISCLLENRLASPAEIRTVTPAEVLKSWRSVWKDRNEDTAYLTAWKRIQDKLNAHVDSSGLRETVDKIKQLWTVGAKFYGIPESFIRVCIASCPVCSGVSDGGFSGGRPKRRRFEYTESFDVPAKEVPNKLQQLAKKHKVVLCIRQKYIRYKPFMAEVKDYACHRAGEPASSKKSRVLKREPYASKRCGCGFRIRAIVPIANYNEKDKSFVYQEEGMAVFKLYAVHSGHEPGPLDGNARIMHRVVGHKGVFLNDQDTEYGVNEELETDSFVGRDDGEFGHSVLQQVQDLKSEVGMLETRVLKLPREFLDSVSQDLYHIVNKVRGLGYEASKSIGLDSDKHHSDIMLVDNGNLPHWNGPHGDRLYGDGKDSDLIEDDDDSFGRTLRDVVPWDQMRSDCRSDKDLLTESCKPEKWLNTSEFDEKSIILSCDDSKLTKPLRHDTLEQDVGLVALQVDSFYPENSKWYDSPCGLDSGTDCGAPEFRHEEIM